MSSPWPSHNKGAVDKARDGLLATAPAYQACLDLAFRQQEGVLKPTLRRHLLQFHSEAELSRWFDPLSVRRTADNQEIVVEFPHALFGQWFDENVKDRFESSLSAFLGPGHRLLYRCATQEPVLPALSLAELSASSIDFPFGHEYTFELFFTNQKNLFPLATAKEIAKSQHTHFNPLVILGESGSGKTHLLRSMANEISKRHDRSLIFLGNADDLADVFAECSHGVSTSLRARLSGYRYFFLDDMDRLASHPALATELHGVFNLFHDARRQMVFTSTHKPGEFAFFSAAVATRLESGIMVQLSPPDLDVRLKFVQDHCQRKKIPLTKAQLLSLAQTSQNFRVLEGVMNKFKAFRELLKKDISDALFENILGQESADGQAHLTAEDIISFVAKSAGLEEKDLTGSKRHKQVVLARQVAMLLCREELGLSYPALGRVFGGKDHSTVVYAIKKIQSLSQIDQVVKELVASLRKTLRQ